MFECFLSASRSSIGATFRVPISRDEATTKTLCLRRLYLSTAKKIPAFRQGFSFFSILLLFLDQLLNLRLTIDRHMHKVHARLVNTQINRQKHAAV